MWSSLREGAFPERCSDKNQRLFMIHAFYFINNLAQGLVPKNPNFWTSFDSILVPIVLE